MNERIYSTFEIAELLSVALSTVIAWINGGKLKAFRTPGGHRRVKTSDLIKFLRDFQMPVPEELAAPAKPSRSQTRKVLIVDDDPIACKQIRFFLSELNPAPEVSEAGDGFEAGQNVLSERPDLVILDIFLPGLDGFEVCKRIRSDPATRATQVIAVTARENEETRKKIMKAGASQLLVKPLEKTELLEVVQRLLKQDGGKQ